MTSDPRADEWNRDLHRDTLPREDIGSGATRSARVALNAETLKDLHTRLPGLTDEELKQTLIEPVGSLLREGSTYVNLRDPDLRSFTAHDGIRATENDAYVAKNSVDYLLWNRIVGVDDPRELDLPDDAALPDAGPR